MTGQPSTTHDQAPEIYEDNVYTEKVDLVAFGLILYEILAPKPVFPSSLPPVAVMRKLIREYFAVVPDEWLPVAKNLLTKCWLINPRARPSFEDIALYLEDNKYEICPEVTAGEVLSFFHAVEHGH